MKFRLPKRQIPKELNPSLDIKATDENDVILELPSPEEAQQRYGKEYGEASFWVKCKRHAASIGRTGIKNALILFYALRSDKLEFKHKAAIIGALGYLISLIDAVPDLTPIIGYSDDLAVLSAAVMAIADVIDEDVKARAETKLQELFPTDNADQTST